MGRIARDSIEEVRRTNDIVDVVNSYVPLQKRGGSFWACCPFHDEKTPSFSVHAVRQTYKCFGCSEFGNVIDFVIKHEKLDFREAVEKLADRSGVRLNFEGGGPTPADRTLRAKALDMMQWAQRGFVANLAKSEPALQYLQSRGLGGEVAERWGIGYAPDEFHRQSDAALKKFDVATVEATGLCKRNERGWYDFFRGRITFPIRDAQQRIVGFGARLLDPDAKAQKYVNSAEGLLFHKSKLLYAIDRLAQSERLKETGQVLIMEGYTDVIAAHEAGFDNAVAPLGTAVTPDHIAVLRRYAREVIYVMDNDSAGKASADRSAEVLMGAGEERQGTITQESMKSLLHATVMALPGELNAKDPFELFRLEGGREAFQQMLSDRRQRMSPFEFRARRILPDASKADPGQINSALVEFGRLLARVPHLDIRAKEAEKVANRIRVPEEAILGAIAVASKEFAADRDRERHGEVRIDTAMVGLQLSPRLTYERELLRRLFEHPVALSAAGDTVFPEMFSTPGLQALYREMVNAWDEHGELVPGALLAHLPPEAKPELEAVLEHVKVPENQSADTDEQARLLKELQKFAEHAQLQGSGALSLDALRQKKGRKGPRRA